LLVLADDAHDDRAIGTCVPQALPRDIAVDATIRHDGVGGEPDCTSLREVSGQSILTGAALAFVRADENGGNRLADGLDRRRSGCLPGRVKRRTAAGDQQQYRTNRYSS
jgi:hypothetical protein